MSDYYHDIYLKRLNRYGYNYQSRVQTQREREFEDYLLKSVYRIDFEYNNELIPGIFEKYKQDETQALYYLLTRKALELPNGTVLQIPDNKGGLRPWMVWYLEDMQVSGYNRHIMLKMTHHIWWLDQKKEKHSSYCYFYGQQDNMLKDEIRSRSRMDTLYAENLKLSFFVLPRDASIHKNDLVFVGEEPYFEQYTITGYDMQSSPGVMYVSADPTYKHDISQLPPQQPSDNSEEYFWLTGGENDAD